MTDADTPGDSDSPETPELPIDGNLDLHTFHPADVRPLLHDYLHACREKGIFTVRIVHGKGTGTLREIVHSELRKMDFVEHFRLAGEGSGGWGATVARLKP